MNLEALRRELLERLAAREDIDPSSIPDEWRSDPGVQRLLAMHRVALALTNEEDGPEHEAGLEFGPWRTLRALGRGGMGEVWLAQRRDDRVTQKVALKRVLMDTPGLRERLHSERQVLAQLSHPNIARLIDVGVDHRGAPWFAMEFVEGTTLTEWCQRQQPALEQRLRLFLKVCAAVEHAHRHLVVHRDLKPSNILVDHEGQPRLLDFGIARILDQERSDGELTWLTCTPGYAAPEQLRGEPISTSVDLYALGLLLFQMLAGVLPRTRNSGNVAQVLQGLPLEEGLRPSEHHLADALPYPRQALQGDLDAIVGQSIRADPVDRYASVAELAADIERHLSSRPVHARPASRVYRLGRFVRRHRLPVAFAAMAVLALGIGVAVALHQARVAQAAAVQARAEADRADAQALAAKAQARRAGRAGEFLLSVFLQADPMRRDARGVISIDQAFDDALQRIDQEFSDDPMVAADLNDNFGEILASKGRFDESLQRLNQALSQAELAYGQDAPEVAETLLNIGIVHAYRGKPIDGEAALERAVAILEARADELPLQLANAYGAIGNVRQLQQRNEESLELQERSMRLFDSHLPEADIRVHVARFNFGATLHNLRRWSEAEVVLAEALAGAESLQGNDSAALLPILDFLITALSAQGKEREAIHAAERMRGIADGVFKMSHPKRAAARVSLGHLLARNGDVSGVPILQQGIAMWAELDGPSETEAWRFLLEALALQGQWSEVLANSERAAKRCETWQRIDASDCAAQRGYQALALAMTGALASAEAAAQALQMDAVRFAAGSYPDLLAQQIMSEIWLARGDRQRAAKGFEGVATAWAKRFDPRHPAALAAQRRAQLARIAN